MNVPNQLLLKMMIIAIVFQMLNLVQAQVCQLSGNERKCLTFLNKECMSENTPESQKTCALYRKEKKLWDARQEARPQAEKDAELADANETRKGLSTKLPIWGEDVDNSIVGEASSYHCPDANASDYEKHPDIKIVTGKGETFKFARDHLYKMLPTIGVGTSLNVEQTKYLESRANQTHYAEETKSINKLNVNFERFPIYDCRYQGEYYSTALVMKPGKHYLPKRVLDILQQPKFKHLLSLSWLERQCGDKKLVAQVWLATPSWKNDNRGDDGDKTVACMRPWDTNKEYPGKFNLHVVDEDKYNRYDGKHVKIYSAEYMMELLANME